VLGPCAKDLKLPLTPEAGGPSTLNADAAADVRSSSWLLCSRRDDALVELLGRGPPSAAPSTASGMSCSNQRQG
jgi:hypothetical protein